MGPGPPAVRIVISLDVNRTYVTRRTNSCERSAGVTPPPTDNPSRSSGKRHIKPVAHNDSVLKRLEGVVAEEFLWEMIEVHEERHNSDRPPNPSGRKQRYKLFDIAVVRVSTLLYPNALAEVNNLRDPKNWERLYQAAEDAFPNNPARHVRDAPRPLSTLPDPQEVPGCRRRLVWCV